MMKIKDIVNRGIVNLQNCDQEPIHIPGSIQPHGFLLSMNQKTSKIEFCSQNTLDYIGIAPKELLGKPLHEVFEAFDAESVLSHANQSIEASATPLQLEMASKQFLCTVNKQDDQIIIEAEPVFELQAVASVYDRTARFLEYMNDTHTLQDLCQLVAQGTRKITGYDRVMVYRFDADYNGEVFAESCDDSLEPFLGLHYPHTDIPVQARELYMKNLLRLIADINYTPVPIFTIDDGTSKTLNLGQSILRSTSPIHIEYLKNMGVGATLTISLIHNKKLWGLIACHHYSAKNLSPEIRLAAQLQGHFLTSQISVRQSNEEYKISRESNAALEKLNAIVLEPKISSLEKIVSQPELLAVCNASGATIQYNDMLFQAGISPIADQTRKLIEWLNKKSNYSHFETNRIKDDLKETDIDCQDVSGLLYYSLGKDSQSCIIWYRPETITQVNWAGDPNKAIEKNENGLSPRKSFELWKEFVKCQSNPWLSPELNAAANYAHAMRRQVDLIRLNEESQRNLDLNQTLTEINSELENINWISTHDLQEPLRKIQLIASRIISKEEDQLSDGVLESLRRMTNSAHRMQMLLVDILKYTKIQHTNPDFQLIRPEILIATVETEMQELFQDRQYELLIGPLPEIKGIEFLLKQLFTNLLANSIKYSRASQKLEIKISAMRNVVTDLSANPESRFDVLSIADNGIGFEPQFAQSIFNIFTRLHAATEYNGSGVGLALCKKIMQLHKGYITASGEENKGAVFQLYFPVQ